MSRGTSKQNVDPEFPCLLVIKTPFPTHRLASTALQALEVDAELSPLVRRKFSLVTPPTSPISTTSTKTTSSTANTSLGDGTTTVIDGRTVLLTEYRAKTNRMLRVAVNGFMESLGVVLGVMERLDVDVMAKNKTSSPVVLV